MKLTLDQRRAAYTAERLSYIEAVPGSGKTTIASERFGYLRYSLRDSRGVIALAYNRAACAELVHRIDARWGSRCVTDMHCVMTFDELYRDILNFLLHRSLISWIGSPVVDVRENYRGLKGFRTVRKKEKAFLCFAIVDENRQIKSVSRRVDGPAAGISKKKDHTNALAEGIVSHDDVRSIIHSALSDEALVDEVQNWLCRRYRAFIVDEVFDLNSLDVDIVKLAVGSDLVVSLIGDPWQTLYGWRGAKPKLVNEMVNTVCASSSGTQSFVRFEQSASFRFSGNQQIRLVTDLRRGLGVDLPLVTSSEVDVILSRRWRDLLDCGDNVLPLALGAVRNQVLASLNLFLNSLTRRYFNCNSIKRDEALAVLGISIENFEPLQDKAFCGLQDRLYRGESPDSVFDDLLLLIKELKGGSKPPVKNHSRSEYVTCLEELGKRLRFDSVVPGITVFQAKGREWDRVGVAVVQEDLKRFAVGISPFAGDKFDAEACILYVAITRGRLLSGYILL